MSARNPASYASNMILADGGAGAPGAWTAVPANGSAVQGNPPPGKQLVALYTGRSDSTAGTVQFRFKEPGGTVVSQFDVTGFSGTPFQVHPVDYILEARHPGGDVITRVLLAVWFDHT